MEVEKIALRISEYIHVRAFPLGLTNYSELDIIHKQLVCPVLAITSVWEQLNPLNCAELGPGSGAMGLMLAALYPEIDFSLVDRRERVVSFIDVAAHALGFSNVIPLQADIGRKKQLFSWDLVILRAFSQPETALKLAASVTERYIAVWHSPQTVGYETAPSGFIKLNLLSTCTPLLVCSIYQRSPTE